MWNVTENGTPLVVWPKVFTIRVKDHRPYRHLHISAFCYCRCGFIQLAKEQLIKVRFAETRARKDKRSSRNEIVYRKLNQNLWDVNLHPVENVQVRTAVSINVFS